MNLVIKITKIVAKLTDEEKENITKTEEIVNRLIEFKRDGIDITIPENIKTLFNSMVDLFSIDYE